MYTRSRGGYYLLQMLFGLTHSPLSLWLRFGMTILIKILRHDHYATIRLPTAAQVQIYKDLIQERHPHLKDSGIAFAADGLKLYLQQTGCVIIQERYYNGWKKDHYVSNMLVFAPDGTIPIMAIDAPGNMHDSKVADYGQVYKKLKFLYEAHGAKSVVDAAFLGKLNKWLLKTKQDITGLSKKEIRESVAKTSCRQYSEWGMRTLQGGFPRLKDRFIYETLGKRQQTIHLIVLLSNLRARLVSINQTATVYKAALNKDIRSMFPSTI